MLNKLFKSYYSVSHSTSSAEEVRQKLQLIYQKINSHQEMLEDDPKINFIVDASPIANQNANQITYYLGGYAIRYDFDDIKSIQLYRRGKVDSLQYAELLAISFNQQIEYIADELFVKSDLYQLDILITLIIQSAMK